jgi:E3 ubiquitin-protein ligase CCNP1IP1
MQTPSTHRQRFGSGFAPSPRMGVAHVESNIISGTPMPNQRTSPLGRLALSNLNANATAGHGLTGYGLTAGIKVSNPAAIERPVRTSRGLIKCRLWHAATDT